MCSCTCFTLAFPCTHDAETPMQTVMKQVCTSSAELLLSQPGGAAAPACCWACWQGHLGDEKLHAKLERITSSPPPPGWHLHMPACRIFSHSNNRYV